MKKRKVGRPTVYRKEHPALLEKILSNGGFNVTFCREVGISEPCFYDWVKKHKEFSYAYKKGSAAAKALFLQKMSDAAWGETDLKVNNGLISLLAVNIHGMVTGKEKVEEEDTAGETYNVTYKIHKS